MSAMYVFLVAAVIMVIGAHKASESIMFAHNYEITQDQKEECIGELNKDISGTNRMLDGFEWDGEQLEFALGDLGDRRRMSEGTYTYGVTLLHKGVNDNFLETKAYCTLKTDIKTERPLSSGVRLSRVEHKVISLEMARAVHGSSIESVSQWKAIFGEPEEI